MSNFTDSIMISLDRHDKVYNQGLKGGRELQLTDLYQEIQRNKYTTIKQVTDAIERIRRELITGEQK